MPAEVPLRRVLVRTAPGADLTSVVDAWRLLSPPPVLRAGRRLPSPAGPVLVVSCQPTRTGVLHRETRVLAGPPLDPAGSGEGDSDLPSRPAALAALVSFAARLLLPAAPPPLLAAFLCVWAARRWRAAPRRAAAVSAPELARRARPTPAAWDPQATAVVGGGLLRLLGAQPGQWRRCELRAGRLRRQLRLQVVPGDVPADVALLSTVLWANLGLPEPGAPGGGGGGGGGGDPAEVTLRVLSADPPPPARAVRLAQLAGPAQLPLAACTAALEAHFARPRLLLPGHVIVTAAGRGGRAVFRVESAEPEPGSQGGDVTAGLLASTALTSLYQVSDVTAPVPPLAPVLDSEWEHGTLPAGLEPELEQLCRLLSPPASRDGPRPLPLLCGAAGSGLLQLAAAAAARLRRPLLTLDSGLLGGDSSAAAASRLQQQLGRARPAGCLVLLRRAGLLGRDRETGAADRRVIASLLESAASLPPPGALLLSAAEPADLLPQLRAHVTHEVALPAPDAARRAALLPWLARRHRVDLGWLCPQKLALQTAGFLMGDLEAVVTQAKTSALARLEEWCDQCDVTRPARPPVLCLDMQDIQTGLDFVRSRQAEEAGAPHIPDTRWQDVGGLAEVKREIVDLIQLPLSRPDLFVGAATRSGVLLYGPPGTGKTLVAKAVATECRLNFLSVKGPELINMYVGQSEANVRDVFRRARDAAPSVVFFDELDSLAPNRGRTGDSGGVMDRVVSQFLAELDGAGSSGQVYVIGATNRPDLIDPALLRPGRFDRLLYLGPSRGTASHTAILRAQTRRLPLSGDVSLEAVVEQLPEAVTGADMYAVCEQATRAALDRAVLMVERGEATQESAPILVLQSDLVEAARSLTPSLSPAQLRQYEQLRETIQGSC